VYIPELTTQVSSSHTVSLNTAIHENHTTKKYRIALTKLRISSHSLHIETGRYINTPRALRTCTNCNMNQPETEYHFILTCPIFKDIRKLYLKPYYCRWPNINKFISPMNDKNKKNIINLSKYVYKAFNERLYNYLSSMCSHIY